MHYFGLMHTHYKKACPLQPAVATWPLRLTGTSFLLVTCAKIMTSQNNLYYLHFSFVNYSIMIEYDGDHLMYEPPCPRTSPHYF